MYTQQRTIREYLQLKLRSFTNAICDSLAINKEVKQRAPFDTTPTEVRFITLVFVYCEGRVSGVWISKQIFEVTVFGSNLAHVYIGSSQVCLKLHN